MALQTIGIRLKAENDELKEHNTKLREENERLKMCLVKLGFDVDILSAPVAPSVSAAAITHRGLKRERVDASAVSAVSAKRLKTIESPHLSASSSSTPYSSATLQVQVKNGNNHFMGIGYDSSSLTKENGNPAQDPQVPHVSCGICTSSADCLCRELGIVASTGSVLSDAENATMTLLDGLPPYQPPASLPIDASASSLGKEISRKDTYGCSGDPRDCLACKDSELGRALCAALGNSVCMLNPCRTCQSSEKTEDVVMASLEDTMLPLTVNPTLTQCCGEPEHCKGGACFPASPNTPSGESSRQRKGVKGEGTTHRTTQSILPITTSPTQITVEEESEDVPYDVAWRDLGAHLNSRFANPAAGNLHLLAEVVAGRSYCTLAPGEPTPEPEDFPKRARPRPQRRTRKTQEADDNWMDIEGDGIRDVADIHANARVMIAYEEDEGKDVGVDMDESGRRLVPREILQGHQRITTEPGEGMRHAIAHMDRHFGCS